FTPCSRLYQLLLQFVGPQLDVRELIGRDQVVEDQEAFAESRSHGRLVIIGLIENEIRASACDGAKVSSQLFFSPTQDFLMPAKRRHDQQNRPREAGLVHFGEWSVVSGEW